MLKNWVKQWHKMTKSKRVYWDCYEREAAENKCIRRGRNCIKELKSSCVNVFMSASRKWWNKLLRVLCVLCVCVDIALEKITWLRMNKVLSRTTTRSEWSWKEKDAGWMYAKKPKRTHEHINNNKNDHVFCSILLRFVCSSVRCSIFCCLFGFFFSFYFFSVFLLLHSLLLLLLLLLPLFLHLFLLLRSVSFFVGSLLSLLLLLRIKFRSTPCLWAWSQWPTTTGLLHIIPNSHTERLFLRSDWLRITQHVCVWMYVYIYMDCRHVAWDVNTYVYVV